MLKDELSKLILETLKTKDTTRREVLRSIKAAIQGYMTDKSSPRNDKGNIIYTEAVEIGILKSMVKERMGNADTYGKGGREDLVKEELAQAKIIESFLPKPPTPEVITAAVEELCKTIEPVKGNIGSFMKEIKAKYPAADGKMVSEIVKARLV